MTNFAVIKTGGKQYIAEEGKTLSIEKIKGEHKVGDSIIFPEVLLNVSGENVKVGTPNTGSKVEAKILEIGKGDKVIVVKYKAKSRYHKKNGHRQPFFKIQITKI